MESGHFVSVFLYSGKETINNSAINLNLYEDNYHQFKIQKSIDEIQIIWFDAEVPIRQWNSICFVRNQAEKRFQIFQNNDLVYSYGQCTTKGKLYSTKPLKVIDEYYQMDYCWHKRKHTNNQIPRTSTGSA